MRYDRKETAAPSVASGMAIRKKRDHPPPESRSQRESLRRKLHPGVPINLAIRTRSTNCAAPDGCQLLSVIVYQRRAIQKVVFHPAEWINRSTGPMGRNTFACGGY
jgi:hypothetical protein